MTQKEKLPAKFSGTMSIEQFIKEVELTDAQIVTLRRMAQEGKLWSEKDYQTV